MFKTGHNTCNKRSNTPLGMIVAMQGRSARLLLQTDAPVRTGDAAADGP
jgi:hypothetical protein